MLLIIMQSYHIWGIFQDMIVGNFSKQKPPHVCVHYRVLLTVAISVLH